MSDFRPPADVLREANTSDALARLIASLAVWGNEAEVQAAIERHPEARDWIERAANAEAQMHAIRDVLARMLSACEAASRARNEAEWERAVCAAVRIGLDMIGAGMETAEQRLERIRRRVAELEAAEAENKRGT